MRNGSQRFVVALLISLFAVFAASGCGLSHRRPSHVVQMVLRAKPLPGQKLDKATLDTVQSVLDRRARYLDGVSYVRVIRKGNSFTVETSAIRDPGKARALLQKTGSLEFYHLKNVNDTEGRGRNKFATWIMSVDEQGSYSFTDKHNPGSPPVTKVEDIKKLVIGENEKPFLTGRDLVPDGTKVSYANQGSRVVVALDFNKAARTKFANFTRTNIHEFLAITLDDKILTAPRINEFISGNPIIEGNFTASEAQQLVDLLNAGALPVELEITSIRRSP